MSLCGCMALVSSWPRCVSPPALRSRLTHPPPQAAYNLNGHIERHAADTYTAHLERHGDELREKPAPNVAMTYYAEEQSLLVETLYDVFVAIRNDELEHAEEVDRLEQDYGVLGTCLSPMPEVSEECDIR